MKKLLALISTEGKSLEQMMRETLVALQKVNVPLSSNGRVSGFYPEDVGSIPTRGTEKSRNFGNSILRWLIEAGR